MKKNPNKKIQNKQPSQQSPINKNPGSHNKDGERIQKVLARGGVASRREIERWIEEGKFQLNGKNVKLGDRLFTGDNLLLNGRRINWEKYELQLTRVLIYHKPTGELVTRKDPEGRPVIFTQLPKLDNGRWIAVGRLDINTQGLVLLTNNGELANRLMHPATEVEREYAVRVLGDVSEETIKLLKKGVELDDGMAHFDDVKYTGGEGANKWYHVVVKEGRNRLVRRLWESQGLTVSRLMRVRYGPIALPEKIKAHTFYEMDVKEAQALMSFCGMDVPKTPVSKAKPENKSSLYRGKKKKFA